MEINVTTVGLDLAKSSFQVFCADESGRCLEQTQLRRGQVLDYFKQLSPNSEQFVLFDGTLDLQFPVFWKDSSSIEAIRTSGVGSTSIEGSDCRRISCFGNCSLLSGDIPSGCSQDVDSSSTSSISVNWVYGRDCHLLGLRKCLVDSIVASH